MKTYSNTPSSLTLDLSANSNIVGVGSRSKHPIWDSASLAITLMATPKSIKVFHIGYPLMKVVTTGITGSASFLMGNLVDIRLASFPPTWTVEGYLFCLPVFLVHSSITILA